MDESKQNLMIKTAIIAAVLFALISLFLVWLHTSPSLSSAPQEGAENVFPDSFSFYHLKANTELSDNVMEKFKKLLGSYAVSKNTTLELGIRKNSHLSNKFHLLSQLDKKLNGRSNERVEHDTTLLTFRHPSGESAFIQYAKLWFSNHNAKPLMVEIKTEAKGVYLVDNIKDKYGPGEYVNTNSDVTKFFYWERKQDYLTVTTEPDRYGEDTYLIKIYYANNLNALYLNEQENQKTPVDDLNTSSEPSFF